MQVLLLKNAIYNVNNWLKNTDYINSNYQNYRVTEKSAWSIRFTHDRFNIENFQSWIYHFLVFII